jgi:hypothetical protein
MLNRSFLPLGRWGRVLIRSRAATTSSESVLFIRVRRQTLRPSTIRPYRLSNIATGSPSGGNYASIHGPHYSGTLDGKSSAWGKVSDEQYLR